MTMRRPPTIRSMLVIAVAAALMPATSIFNEAKAQATPPGAPPDLKQAPPATAPERPMRRGQAGQTPPLRIPDEVQVVRDVVYSTAKTDAGEPIELKLDAVFLKESNDKPMPAIIYIHGGGWQAGSKQSGLQQSVALAMGGYFAVTIDYRLSGQAKFPAAVDDCKNAVIFLREHAEELGVDPKRIGVWGHSAGGHLSALLGTSGDIAAFSATSKGDKNFNQSAAVQCVVDISGPVDLTGDVEGNPIGTWLGGTPDQRAELAKRASPLTYIDANDPPVLIVHGTADGLVKIRHAEMFEKALKAAKVNVEYLPVEGAGHGIIQPRVYVRIAEFFDEHLGGNAGEFVRMLPGRRSPPSAPPPSGTEPTAPPPPAGEQPPPR